MEPSFRCRGCGAIARDAAAPFRCPAARAGDDVDHVLVRSAPAGDATSEDEALDEPPSGANPFERYRRRLSFWALGRSRGLDDAAIVEIVRALDCRVAAVDGRGFAATPFLPQAHLRDELGGEVGLELWVKDETRNVSGSHKARHLAGVMLYLEVAERVDLLRGRPTLAIASCGNAALAAAVVARAASWPLEVFVPPSANASVVERLHQLGAHVTTCTRQPGVAGDPCYLAFHEAVAAGSVPFCCQGSDNGLTIEGGKTLAWEILDALPGPSVDAVFVQVGGGALASAIVQGFEEARHDGAARRLPGIFTVQTSGAYPLARAYDRLVARILATWPGPDDPPSESPASLAEALAQEPQLVAGALSYARSHRSEFMWPWEEEPRSIAHGILDDETYDWAAVLEGMLRTGGRPIVVSESRLEQANALARSLTGVDVDHTGSAGLAGLLEALSTDPRLGRARLAVIFSGARR